MIFQPHKFESDTTRKTSVGSSGTHILPDILRNVTLEEIIQAVDIVTEEEEAEKINQEVREQHWNIGVQEENKSEMFLQNIDSYFDDTESIHSKQ